MRNYGLLLTLTEPPAAMEEEFNAWYDTEHLAERLAIPGFRSARRWIGDCKPGEGKYLATYELDSAEVLRSAAYLERFNHQSPWSRRCLGKAVVFRRWACEQVDPGRAEAHAAARAIAFATAETAVPGTLQTRRFQASSGEKIFLHELGAAPATALPGVLFYRAYAA